MMKQVLKKTLPQPVLQKVIVLRDRIKLNMIPCRNFSAEALKPGFSAQNLNNIFSDPLRGSDWARAQDRIEKIYGRTTAMGGVNPGDRKALYYLIHALKPQSVLEVGTHIGASTVFIAEALKDSVPDAHLTTVDILDVNDDDGPWKQQGLLHKPSAYLEKLGHSGRVAFRSSSSATFLSECKDKFDFIFLDGDHSSCTVYEEVSLALKVLNKDGIILLHDYYPAARPLFNDGNIIAGPFMAVDRIMRENKNIRILPLGNLPWETKQGLKVTSLALLTRP